MGVTTYESFSEISASETTSLITTKNGNHSDFSPESEELTTGNKPNIDSIHVKP
jgi:hypothetical protein